MTSMLLLLLLIIIIIIMIIMHHADFATRAKFCPHGRCDTNAQEPTLIYGGGASTSGSEKPTRLLAELKRKGAFEAAGETFSYDIAVEHPEI